MLSIQEKFMLSDMMIFSILKRVVPKHRFFGTFHFKFQPQQMEEIQMRTNFLFFKLFFQWL